MTFIMRHLLRVESILSYYFELLLQSKEEKFAIDIVEIFFVFEV
jgi:hypothetical protein